MTRELGLTPRKFGSLANEQQEPWKRPLAESIANTRRARKRPLARLPPGLAYHYPKQRTPDLDVDGEIHGDVALDSRLRKEVLPESTLEGDANHLGSGHRTIQRASEGGSDSFQLRT
jgi:Phosphate acetyl/butaryl transferase